MTERSADCRLYHRLCVHHFLVSIKREVLPVIQMWLRFAQLVADRFPVCETPATYDAVRMFFPRKCERRHHQSRSPIQFHLNCMAFRIHHCDCRLNERFPKALACRAPSWVRYSPCFVLSFFIDAWAVLLEPRSPLDRMIGSDMTAAGLSGSESF